MNIASNFDRHVGLDCYMAGRRQDSNNKAQKNVSMNTAGTMNVSTSKEPPYLHRCIIIVTGHQCIS